MSGSASTATAAELRLLKKRAANSQRSIQRAGETLGDSGPVEPASRGFWDKAEERGGGSEARELLAGRLGAAVPGLRAAWDRLAETARKGRGGRPSVARASAQAFANVSPERAGILIDTHDLVLTF